MTEFPRPSSNLTHDHIADLCVSAAQRLEATQQIRILDVGCGNCELTSFLYDTLRAEHPGVDVQLYGFDVFDGRVQESGFFNQAIDTLQSRHPEVAWAERINQIQASQQWPFDDGFFDIVVSNQVLEHVRDLEHFMTEHHRVLQPGGHGVHLFPLRGTIVEGHTYVPWAHRLLDYRTRTMLLTIQNRLGLGSDAPLPRDQSLSDTDDATLRSDYVDFSTKYRTWRMFYDSAQTHGLNISHFGTSGFYLRKALSLVSRRPGPGWTANIPVLLDSIMFPVLTRINSITLELRKPADGPGAS